MYERSVFIWWNKADLVSNQIFLCLIIDLNTILFTCSVMVGLQLMTLLFGFLVLLLLLLSSLIGVPCHLRCRCFYTCFKIYFFFIFDIRFIYFWDWGQICQSLYYFEVLLFIAQKYIKSVLITKIFYLFIFHDC